MEELFYKRYRKEKLIGRGAFSEVWMVTDTLTGVTQALKIYSPSSKMEDDGIEMMVHEFALMANVNHQNLLHPLSFDICDSRPFLVLPFCKNGNINSKIGKFTEKEAWELLRDAANALAYLHAMEPPVIHQDIKPANILISDDGSYMLTDFGVSTKAKSTMSRLSAEDKSLLSAGTLSYMAPEKFSSNNLPIMANDIFSLGSTVYEMLTGYLPFGNEGGLLQKMGADIPELQGDYSSELKEVLKECLAKEPWERPSAKDLAKFATNMVEGKPVDFKTQDITPEPQPVEQPVLRPEAKPAPQQPEPQAIPQIEPQPGQQPQPIQPEPRPIQQPEPQPMPQLEEEQPIMTGYPSAPLSSGGSGKKIALIAAIAILLIGAGAGLWWFFSKDKAEKPTMEMTDTQEDTSIEDATGTVDLIPEAQEASEANQEALEAEPLITEEEAKPTPPAKTTEEKVTETKPKKEDTKKAESVKPDKQEQPVEQPKPKGGNLSYGSWSGKVAGGKPDGIGTLTFTSAHSFKCGNGKTITPQAGDKLTNAEFENGILYQATWNKSNGATETILP